MSEQLVFGQKPPRPELPAWFDGGTPTQRARVLRGMHPAGTGPFGPSGETCGTCGNLVATNTPAGKTFYKCSLVRQTGGPGTDIRRKWMACERWSAA